MWLSTAHPNKVYNYDKEEEEEEKKTNLEDFVTFLKRHFLSCHHLLTADIRLVVLGVVQLMSTSTFTLATANQVLPKCLTK